MKVEIN